jgi:hypothetical protein
MTVIPSDSNQEYILLIYTTWELTGVRTCQKPSQSTQGKQSHSISRSTQEYDKDQIPYYYHGTKKLMTGG